MDESVRPCFPDAPKRIAEPEARVTEQTLTREMVLHADKPQAAPIPTGPPRPIPQTPGRESGDEPGTQGRRTPHPVRSGGRKPENFTPWFSGIFRFARPAHARVRWPVTRIGTWRIAPASCPV